MLKLSLAAALLSMSCAAAEAGVRHSILNSQACECGTACGCSAGECGDASCAAKSAGCSAGSCSAPGAFMQRGPVRRAASELRPARRVLRGISWLIRHRPRLLRLAAGRIFGGCGNCR